MTEPNNLEARLKIEIPQHEIDNISGKLWELGTTGIEEQTGANEILLLAGFRSVEEATKAADVLVYPATLEEFSSREYLDLWRDHAIVYHVGSRLVIRPPWLPYEAKANELVIHIEPGHAFGSGSHPSTQLALEHLEITLEGNESVLDVGCGSGILSVTSARLGAVRVLGIDIDRKSLILTKQNAEANGVSEFVFSSSSSIEEIQESFDVVVANILPHVLTGIANQLISKIKPEGQLILSGLLEHQIESVTEAFYPLRLFTTKLISDNQQLWAGITLGH